MKNKGGIILLTVVVSLLCIYYLSFTFVSQGVQRRATEYATDAAGTVDFSKKQQYLDSVWNEPVYNFLGIEFTYKEIKETELNLGLDLQGGMHVTLEVSPIEIVKGLSGESKDPAFLKSLTEAREATLTSQASFVPEFYAAYQRNAPGQKLSYIFANAANRGRISLQSTDQEVLDIINTEVEGAIDRSFQILRTRIDRFGTSQPNIQRLPGTGRIQIELPGVDNPERVRKLLQGVARLEFWEVNEMNDIFSTLSAINQLLVDDEKSKNAEVVAKIDADSSTEAADTTGTDDLAGLLSDTTSGDATDLASQLESDTSDISSLSSGQSPLFSLMKGGYGLMYDVKDTAKINRIFERKDVQGLIPSTMKFLWAVKPTKVDDFSSEELLELYAVKTTRGGRAPLTGEVITDARQDLDQSARPAVTMQMNTTGAKAWKKLTGENINRRIAIVLDNYVYSAPMVQGEIPNGSSSITGTFTLEEAKDLANVLKAGTLPAPTTIVEDVVIGPTLGKEAQQQGIISIVAGLAIVIIFMVAYYAKGGLIANLALAFNVFFILGILAQLSASLTLPGIAGIVLTIGMAIDANVLIFERIREELRGGASIKQAISGGYEKAYSSIIDSNATTFLTGLILYTLGQGPVKGFAITLMIGIVCSFFSAVFITRVIVEWWSKKGEESKISFDSVLSKNFLQDTKIDFIGKRRLAYIFSGSFIVLGIIAFIIKGGLSMGVDFTGGRSYIVSFASPQVPSELKVKLSDSFDGQSTEVKWYGGDNVLKITTSYLINNESDEADLQVRQSLIDGLTSITGLQYTDDDSKVDATHFTISSSSKVGATIADDIKASSTESVIFALITIFLYILIRFRRWQFGLGALIALFHDVLFVLAALAIANLLGVSFEVDQVFIAAMLTLIGYSINDTVVVFDRVRENMQLRPSSENSTVFNLALNETISRTTITSATTLFVVLILFLFGGAVLKGFSFTLLVGILIGTYSSLFIATPVVLDFDKKDKK
jgi:SecD/SecF fusion protein